MGKVKHCLRHRNGVKHLVDPDCRESIFKAHGQLDYCRFRSERKCIFTNGFPRWTPKTPSRLAAKAGNCRHRIHEWYKTWGIDRHWRPSDCRNRGVHHLIFTPEEEAAIEELTFMSYVISRVLFANHSFRDLAIWAFLGKHSGIGTFVPFFNVSSRVIAGFKLRNWSSSRSFHLKRRPPPASLEIKCVWRSDWELLLHDRMLNYDENCWQFYPNRLKVWGLRDSSNVAVKT
jgi:hypothetical protein